MVYHTLAEWDGSLNRLKTAISGALTTLIVWIIGGESQSQPTNLAIISS